MRRSKKRRLAILLAGLVACAALGSLCLACTIEESNPQNPTATEGGSTIEGGSTTTEGGSIMATEEAIAANAATILSYFEEVGFEPAPNTREGAAEEAAALFSSVSDAQIKTITSEPDPYDGGPIDLMVTDENGQDFVLSLSRIGSVQMIEDGDGKIVSAAIQ